MSKTNIGWITGILFFLAAMPALGLSGTAITSFSDSSVILDGSIIGTQNNAGQLTWMSNSMFIGDIPSPSSSYVLTLTREQKTNALNRMNELIVRFAEEFFKNDVLRQVLLKKMLSGTTLTAFFSNGNLVFWDSVGEVYNANHVQVIQTSLNCPTGSICFNGRMYGSNGQLIQKEALTIFPPGSSNLIIAGGIDQ